MSTLAVAKIESSDDLTDLVITTANTNSGNVRVFASNNTILFSGNPVFTGAIPGIDAPFGQANTARTHANAAFDQANTALTTGQAAFGQANTALTTGQAAFDQANTAASTGKAIAMAIVFG